MTVILGKLYRDAVRAYYRENNEKVKVVRRLGVRNELATLCHVTDSTGTEWSTIVTFGYDADGQLYATELDSTELERENEMVSRYCHDGNCDDTGDVVFPWEELEGKRNATY